MEYAFPEGGRNQVRADRYPRDKDVIRSSGGFDPIYVNDCDTRDKIWGGKGYRQELRGRQVRSGRGLLACESSLEKPRTPAREQGASEL